MLNKTISKLSILTIVGFSSYLFISIGNADSVKMYNVYYASTVSPQSNKGYWGYDGRFIHSGKANTLFFDGHVAKKGSRFYTNADDFKIVIGED